MQPGMSPVIVYGFAISVVYAVLGHVIVYVVLLRRHAPMRFMWAGTPGYLTRVCHENPALAGPALRWFSISTVLAFFLAFLFAIGLSGGRN